MTAVSHAAKILCGHCGGAIRRPEPGSYPPDIEWVHERSIEPGNRWCLGLKTTAVPANQEAGR